MGRKILCNPLKRRAKTGPIRLTRMRQSCSTEIARENYDWKNFFSIRYW